jgi:hypothetical protein
VIWLQLSSIVALNRREFSALGPGSYPSGESTRILSIGDWVGYRICLEVLESIKIPSPAWIWTIDYRVCSLVSTANALSQIPRIIMDINEMYEVVKSVRFRRGTGDRLTRTWECTFGEIPEYLECYYLVMKAFAVRLLSFAGLIWHWMFVLIDTVMKILGYSLFIKLLPYWSVAAKRQFDYSAWNQALNLMPLQQFPSVQTRDIPINKHAPLTRWITLWIFLLAEVSSPLEICKLDYET